MAFKWLKKKKEKKSKELVDIPDEPEVIEETPIEAPIMETLEDQVELPLDEFSELKKASVPQKIGFFKRLKKGLTKTRKILTTDLDVIFQGKQKIDDEMLEDLEGLLITSDIGVRTSMDILDRIRSNIDTITDAEMLKEVLKKEILSLFENVTTAKKTSPKKPHVIMVVGVNGVGKTTTVGKLAAKFSKENKKVIIAAADTFRAAAIDQLDIWAQRANATLIKHKENSDPSAVAFDAMQASVARKADIVFVDTAGRLHTKVNLMEEIKKIDRTIGKVVPSAPHETLLVLDATTGQNALAQAEMFHKALGVTSLALTKLDGTAKGGIVISICSTLKIPLKYIGVGESVEDLQEFDPEEFVNALF